MRAVTTTTIGAPERSQAGARDAFRQACPGYELASYAVSGTTTLRSDGVAYHWIDSGSALVWLDAGYLTQEGDGAPLPDRYRTVPLPEEVRAAFEVLADAGDSIVPEARSVVRAMAGRFADGRFGEVLSDLTSLWASHGPPEEYANGDARRALGVLTERAHEIGWSEKVIGGWEPLQAGDLLVTTPRTPLTVRGEFRAWRITDSESTSHAFCSSTRRLALLRDTAGGCAPHADAFRRLALPWSLNPHGAPGDGVNRLNSHAVNITADHSRTHFHPVNAVGGGAPQTELYLVIDPAALGLRTGGQPRLDTFPDIEDWTSWQTTPLRPGDLVIIPPGVGHRGVDVLANVVALPGFKPRNEIYVDAEIAAATRRRSPHNPVYAGKVEAAR
ncbi:hypothetical protein [Actinopolymorpha alba]|uniref:hypothetical protein n=1 Tax=Actinopolymorpha alba TaxID=533267 RepID=UPI0003A2A9FC|nr:hypothetical protein [Actinopolymorpha alba]